MITWLLCIAGAYLLGSIPFGLFLGLARGVDIRAAGSGNVGATNVARLLGRRLGVLCFVLDAAKGAVPVTLAGWINGVWGVPAAGVEVGATPAEIWLWLAVAAAALLGHSTSPWLGFRGGKGVATGFGALLALWPHLTVPALAAMIVWVALAALTRYVSVASMAAAASLPILCLLLALRPDGDVAARLRGAVPLLVTTAALAALVVFKHRGNIARLRRGTESRIGGGGRRTDETTT